MLNINHLFLFLFLLDLIIHAGSRKSCFPFSENGGRESFSPNEKLCLMFLKRTSEVMFFKFLKLDLYTISVLFPVKFVMMLNFPILTSKGVSFIYIIRMTVVNSASVLNDHYWPVVNLCLCSLVSCHKYVISMY